MFGVDLITVTSRLLSAACGLPVERPLRLVRRQLHAQLLGTASITVDALPCQSSTRLSVPGSGVTGMSLLSIVLAVPRLAGEQTSNVPRDRRVMEVTRPWRST